MQANPDVGQQPKNMQRWKAFLPICLLLAYQLVLHIIIQPTFGDDAALVKGIGKAGLIPWLLNQYQTWSSRLLLESVLALMLQLPAFIWKLTNIAMVLLTYCSLRSLLTAEMKLKESVALALLLCCYPFYHMCSAGWITTTV